METGTKVEIMERGQWVGPFTVTAQAGRTADHVVLSGPSGSFELYADAPFNIRPVAPTAECQDATPLVGVIGASVNCRRPWGHPGAHRGSGVEWGGKRPARDEFGPWVSERHESNASGRNYLVVQRLEATPGVSRIHRAATGAPVWYTQAGAERKAAALNAAG